MIVLGSAGRGESLLAMDQDNAVIFERGEPDGGEDRWFAAFGALVADILHEVGVPYCKGGVMAKNAPWRGSVATWQSRIDHWIARSNPKDLLSVDIFFDLRAVYGDGSLAVAVRQAAFDAAEGQAAFAKLLVEGISVPRSVGFFGGIRTENGRIDLKRSGLFGVVSAARAMAIRYDVMERSTPARLAGVKALRSGRRSGSGCACRGAWRVSRSDPVAADRGHRPRHPALQCGLVKRLSARDHERLRSSLEAVASVDAIGPRCPVQR